MSIQTLASDEKMHIAQALLHWLKDEDGQSVPVLLMNFVTDGTYQYSYLNNLVYATDHGDGQIEFSDSLVLSTYPYIPESYWPDTLPVTTQVGLFSFEFDSPMTLAITCRNRRYVGAFTVTRSHELHIDWDNSGDNGQTDALPLMTGHKSSLEKLSCFRC